MGHLNTKDSRFRSNQRPSSYKDIDDANVSSTSSDLPVNDIGSKNETTGRFLRLLHLLRANDWSRDDIFGALKDYYKIGDDDDPKAKITSERAVRILLRDLLFLNNTGCQI